MAYLIGVGLALAVCLLATFGGLDRDRAFYPTVTIVIASYYGLFAIMGGSTQALATDSAIVVGFIFVSILGFRRNLWLLVAALVMHGLFDWIHGHLISNPGVPLWWPAFCLTYDVTSAGYLTWLLLHSQVNAIARIEASSPLRQLASFPDARKTP